MDTHTIRTALRIATAETATNAAFAALVIGPFATGFLLAWGASDFQLGLFSTLPALASGGEVLGAYLADHFARQRRKVVAWTGFMARSCFFLTALLAWAGGFSETWFLPSFFVVTLIFQCLYHASGPGWMAWMAILVPARIRGRYLGIRNRIVDITGLLTLVAAGAALDHFRALGIERQGFSLLHLIAGCIGFVCLILILKQYDPGHHSLLPQLRWSYVLAPLLDRRFRRLLGINLFWLAGMTFYTPFSEAHVIKHMQWSFKGVSFLVVVSTLAAVIANPWWGRLSDRIGAKSVLTWCMVGLLCVPMVLYLTPLDDRMFVYVAWGLLGVFSGGYALAMFSLTLECLPEKSRAMGAGLLATLTSPLIFLAGLSAGWGAEFFGGYGVIFLASIVLRLPAFLFLSKL